MLTNVILVTKWGRYDDVVNTLLKIGNDQKKSSDSKSSIIFS